MIWRHTMALGLAVSAAPLAAQAEPSVFSDAVALWHMDSQKDAAGANSALEPVGGGVRYGVELEGAARQASVARGGDGRAVRLDNSSVTPKQGAGGEVNLTGDAVTIAMRLKNTTSNWDVTLFSKHGGHEVLQYNVFCFNMPGGALDLGFELGTDAGAARAGAVLSPEEVAEHDGWHDIVARYDGKTVDLFVDGELRGTSPHSGALRPANPEPLAIGGEPGGGVIGRHFTGLIDHAAIWGRALSNEEIAVLSGAQQAPLYAEPYRPQFHFSPERNWINDPNGMAYHNGEWHLAYQYNPFGNTWGHMSWGHAVSKDLVHWEHLPLAIPEQGGVMSFSGCAVSDVNNTSGFGRNGETPLVAIYTGHIEAKKRQDQRLAYSLDNGRTWTQYEGNPVIDINAAEFRDPKVFWHEATGKWVMVVALAKEHKVRIYGSKDLKSWDHLSDFGPAGAVKVPNWECPDLFELAVDGTNEKRWVMVVNVGDGAVAGGSGVQYFVGDFDGKTFTSENPRDTILWADYGRDAYAFQSWDNAPGGRRVWLAWMNNWQYANAIPTFPERGAMTAPREVGLTRTAEGVRLVQTPAAELEKLRGEPVVLEDVTLEPGADPLAALGVEGDTLDIEAEFEVDAASRFGLRVREGASERTDVGYDLRLREVFVDRRDSGQDGFHAAFAGYQHAKLPVPKDGRITLRILVDRSSVEVFANGGVVSITDRIFPSLASRGVSLFAEEGPVRIAKLTIYPLRSVWTQHASTTTRAE